MRKGPKGEMRQQPPAFVKKKVKSHPQSASRLTRAASDPAVSNSTSYCGHTLIHTHSTLAQSMQKRSHYITL